MGMADLWNNFLRKKCFFVRLWSAFSSDNLSLNPQFLKNLAYFLLIKFPNGGAMCQNLDVEAVFKRKVLFDFPGESTWSGN